MARPYVKAHSTKQRKGTDSGGLNFPEHGSMTLHQDDMGLTSEEMSMCFLTRRRPSHCWQKKEFRDTRHKSMTPREGEGSAC